MQGNAGSMMTIRFQRFFCFEKFIDFYYVMYINNIYILDSQ